MPFVGPRAPEIIALEKTICDLFGEDPAQIQSLVLELSNDKIPTATFRKIAREKQTDQDAGMGKSHA